MRGNRLYKNLDGWLGRLGILLLSSLPEPSGRPRAEKPARILVIKLSALGDTVLLVPALRALRERFPEAEIGMVGTRVNEEIALEYSRYVDRFFCLDVARATREPWTLLKFVREIRRDGWDVGIDFDQWTYITPVLLRLAGVPRRIGFETHARLRHRLYTDTETRQPGRHEAENFLSLLAPLGIVEAPLDLELEVDPGARLRAERRLEERGWNGSDPLIVVQPGTGAPGTVRAQRAWPVESYAELLRRLSDEGETFFVAVTAAPDERDLAQRLLHSQDAPGTVLTLDLRELIGCLSLASLVISGNSGTMHLAAALGQPQVALHGPAGAVKWGPLNRKARVVESTCPECPCLDMGWEYHRTDGFCMGRISVDAVLEPALQILAHSRSPAGIGEGPGSTRASSPGSRGRRVLEMQGSGG